MSDPTLIRGVLQKADPCWRITEEDTDEQFFLVGDITGVRDGDLVYVVGQSISTDFCGEGETLLVSWIGTKIEGRPALKSVVKRDVDVTIPF